MSRLIGRENSDAQDQLVCRCRNFDRGWCWSAPSTGDGIEPFKLMLTAKELPTVEFADYTFVFH
jgi:hypothetical protein